MFRNDNKSDKQAGYDLIKIPLSKDSLHITTLTQVTQHGDVYG